MADGEESGRTRAQQLRVGQVPRHLPRREFGCDSPARREGVSPFPRTTWQATRPAADAARSVRGDHTRSPASPRTGRDRHRRAAAALSRPLVLGHDGHPVPGGVQRQPVQATDAAAGAEGGRAGSAADRHVRLFGSRFVLFSGYAGYLADRYSKQTIIVLSKVAEIVAMLLGAGRVSDVSACGGSPVCWWSCS